MDGYSIEKRGDLKQFCNSFRISLIKFLGIKFYPSFNGEKVDNSPHELDSIFFLVDIIRDISLRIIFLSKPIEDIGDEFKVRFIEVLE